MAILVSFTSSNLRESVIEIGAIWGSFAIVLGPVFLLGVTSRKVTGRVIWFGITACWGATLGMVAWYSVSKSGHTGSIAEAWWAVPAAVAALLFVIARLGPSGPRHLRFAAACLGTTALGFGIATGFWYLMARHTAGGELSFLWLSFPGLVLMLLIGYGSIPFLRNAHASHHTGLTLWSTREDVQDRA